ncbi:MAG TPA: adenylate/guanylate cyclase domain-containing protein [Gaiellaceae bacterium]|nr:adenylate/guanylate cyclase domain-containing protein [Gaiellaceae bacterium]
MLICPHCGKENSEGARFCNECAAPLVTTASSREQRKVVTVLFCDVTGSTELGEQLDPEALRALLARYFARMKAIVESQGGTVEKFIGDAVMAVFGVPVAHEDDALRALRAALEMRDAFPEVGVQGRIGVTTGEVVTGTEERLATGDAVNVAARLEQAANPGEVLIGAETLRLTRDSIEVEALEPLALKGKAEAVPAFRLLAVHEAPERPHGALFVGREGEVATLHEAWYRAQTEQRCELVTIVADAGVGKTRLAAEALGRFDATVVRGRCVSYGEGITYLPVVDVVKQLDALPSAAAAAAAIHSLLGETEAGTSAEEIAWAFRKLLEERAQTQPLVVVFEDIHWGEETFLDLIEQVALLAAGAPILLLCTTRPELIDRRPTWPVTLRLGPLAEEDIEQLIPASVPTVLREKILRTAGGNPLFITEMVAITGEAGDEVVVPPTLRALLAARLDQLDVAERRVLECGAVEGEIFHRTAVQTLAPEEPQVTARLAALVRRELVSPERAQIPGDDGFRFRHVLIRDAAYGALPKAMRAELHERLAAWLEQRDGDLAEPDEILGYHLAQACHYKAELGQGDPALAERAGERLASAGRRALWRGDDRAATGLLQRALELTRPARLDVVLELDLAQALDADGPRAEGIAAGAADRARAAGDEAGDALARAAAAFYRSLWAPDPAIDELETLARDAIPLLERAEDHAGLVHVWWVLGMGVANFRGHWDDWAQAAEQALRHARLAGQRPTNLFALELALASGSRPAGEALQTLDALLPENPHPGSLMTRAWLLAMLGRFEEASAIAQESSDRLRELTGENGSEWMLADIAKLAGDHEAAAHHLQRVCELLEERGQRFFLSSLAPMLGHELCALGRHEEAARWAQVASELAVRQNALGQALLRQVQALVEASRGRHIEAERSAREAVGIIERTDGLNYQGDALCDLAEVLELAGKPQEARAALAQALDRYERKRNIPAAARVRDLLEKAPTVGSRPT